MRADWQEDFEKNGFVHLGNLISQERVAALRERIDAIMLGKVVHEGMFFQHDSKTGRYEDAPIGEGWVGPSLEYRKIEKLERDPLFYEHINDPTFESIVRARIAGDIVLYRAIVMNKSAAGGSDLPWHQDGGTFWGLDKDPELQVWTALDDAPLDGGCLEFVPGTHKLGLATPLGGVIPREMTDPREHEKVLVPARAGDVVLIHNYVWHRSGRTQTGQQRRAFSVCYMSANTKCRRKKRAPRQFVEVFRR